MNKKQYKIIISLGKIAYNGKYKNNELEIEIKLTQQKGINYKTLKEEMFWGLSISCDVWNKTKSDIVMGGQCLDKIKEHYLNDLEEDKRKLFLKIYDLWNKWHLNYLIAGTYEQEKALKEWKDRAKGWSYDTDVNYLKKKGLYEYKGYKYGSKWLSKKIDEKDLKEIKKIIGI